MIRGKGIKLILFVLLMTVCFLSCSRTNTPLEDSLKTNENDFVHIIAHRGFWKSDRAKGATNSVASLMSAQEYRIWGCEFDVRITCDSIPIVYHDEEIDGVRIADNPFSSFSKYRLPNGESIPTLERYLSVAAEDSVLVLVMELKAQSTKAKNILLIDKSLELLSKYGLLSPKRVVFISFSTFVCERLAYLLPDFTVQALFTERSLTDVHKMGMKGIDFFQDILIDDPSIISCAHDLGMEVNVWPVNEVNNMRTLIKYDVDFITTDDPLSLRAVLRDLSRNK